MSIKLPVITSNFKLYEEVVVKNECGFCIDPYSPEDLADKIEVLLKDGNKVTHFGNNGYNTVKNSFNWSNEEKKLLKRYDIILKETL